MTLQIVVKQPFTNPLFPPSDAVSLIYRDSAQGIYEMLSSYDRSGKGNHLKVNGHTFGPQGLISTPNTAHYADTGIMLPNTFSMIFSHYIAAAPTATGNIYSNLNPGANPFTGTRMAVSSAGGAGSFAIGQQGGSAFLLNIGGIVSGWTTYCFSVNGGHYRLTRQNGQTFEGDIPGTVAPGIVPVRLAGGYIPTVNIPMDGILGLAGIYFEDLTVAQQLDLITKARQILARRGIA
ncbi:hypothetical protein [Pseudomonas phage UF_RH7]|nr:hypothetical protein [Pseudomonas phage UF_RH7]